MPEARVIELAEVTWQRACAETRRRLRRQFGVEATRLAFELVVERIAVRPLSPNPDEPVPGPQLPFRGCERRS
jgi:hypothetical protein